MACALIPLFMAESTLWFAVWLNYWDYGLDTLRWHRRHRVDYCAGGASRCLVGIAGSNCG